jgi:hypothetical protein
MLIAEPDSRYFFRKDKIEGDYSSISRILGYFDFNGDGTKDFIFVNKQKQLCALLNYDPNYVNEVVL